MALLTKENGFRFIEMGKESRSIPKVVDMKVTSKKMSATVKENISTLMVMLYDGEWKDDNFHGRGVYTIKPI